MRHRLFARILLIFFSAAALSSSRDHVLAASAERLPW